jgi:signal transduction histidine kinase
LKKNDDVRKLLLRLPGVYRIFAYAAVFAMLFISNNKIGIKFTTFQINYLILLGLGSILYFLLLNHKKILSILLSSEYFLVLLYGYVTPNLLFMELLWVPGIIAALAFAMPKGTSLIFVPAFGIIGAVFFSYGHINDVVINIEQFSIPYRIAILFLYIPITLFSTLVNRIFFTIEKIELQYSTLKIENTKLDEINQAISQRIFGLQSDTTQKERNRLSKDIHDTAGYVFINLIMMLQAASAVLYKDIKKTDKLINDARDYAEKGINEIRHLLRDIRGYTPIRMSLQNEFFNIGESFQKATEVKINIEYGLWPKSLSKNLDSFFISFMQESLTNALKHGHAANVSVLCWMNNTHLGMTIIDNGAGAKFPIKKGIGITAMEDVMNQLNGSIYIRSGKDGFKITAVIPESALI